MRIAVVGAGAVGCYLAARLSDHGHDLTLIARPAQAEAINRDGLRLHDAAGHTWRYHLRAREELTERPDLALLTVKTQDVADTCRAAASVLHDVPVVTMQNGVRGDHLAAEALGSDSIVGAVVMCAASYLQPGEVSVQFPGWLIAGAPFGPLTPRARAVAGVLRAAVPTYVTHHLERVRWSKLISNLNNALCAVTALTLAEIVAHPAARALPVRLMKEGCAVARAAGIRLDHGLYGLNPRTLRRDPTAALIALLQGTMTTLLAALPEEAAASLTAAAGRGRLGRLPIRFSTWQSIARGRPSEIEYLNGEIVRQGQDLGIATPLNARLVEMVHEVERTGSFVGMDALLALDRAPATAVPTAGGTR